MKGPLPITGGEFYRNVVLLVWDIEQSIKRTVDAIQIVTFDNSVDST